MDESKAYMIIADAVDAFDPRENGYDVRPECVTTFEEGGVMTKNRGFTVRFDDGSEFQVTVIRSK